ncbi:methyltransferase domain-containing protein [Pseudacidovorax sp. 1753]|uniref:methyltransferase domain-containing protein n=1 Tax=Pseudacidovorax sp. 1753 TaxID=3156419 RepID=UPI00339B3DDD
MAPRRGRLRSWAHDLGTRCGHRKFIPVLRQCGGNIVAVEPIDAMRLELLESFPDILALSGSAESIPLPDASMSAVVCAQAFMLS